MATRAGRAAFVHRHYSRCERPYRDKGITLLHLAPHCMIIAGTAMNETLPSVYVVRHGETAGSLSAQHTGLTDLPLTERDEADARALGDRLRGLTLGLVLTS